MLKKTITFIIVILISFLLIDTTPTGVLPNSNSKAIANVAVLLYNFSDSFTLRLKNSFEAIEKENKDKVHFTFYDGINNIHNQVLAIDSLPNTDFIIATLAETDEHSVTEIVERVKQKNIPLILFEVNPEIATKISKIYNKVVFASINAEQSGINEANIIIDLWNTNKNLIDKNHDDTIQYIMLTGQVNNVVSMERSKHSIQTINKAGIKTEEIAKVTANWSKEIAKEAIDNLFLRYGGKIEAIISNNDPMAIGAIEILQKYGYNKGDKSKYIAVVGVDGIQEAKTLIDQGFMLGTIIQDTKDIAEILYTLGINLTNNLSPVANTPYSFKNGVVIFTLPYDKYVNKPNFS
ncbi:galactose ABC transporter substrate-binding protein [Clostridium sp. SHJSY1]|uniref:galactose ABC transporter substrate-binding protein n=1 Tax=Clostridium sp. SHJSY1 TaxID=2942483 RepID=UPI0028764672|nr:galactose ABC transporter substrate-binding protein [Clostridium sp. SHJSY1]MDS0525391.1 galactose ABC transporter substrate-binding protein [Clostridium sp. SHJSY1]